MTSIIAQAGEADPQGLGGLALGNQKNFSAGHPFLKTDPEPGAAILGLQDPKALPDNGSLHQQSQNAETENGSW